MIHFFVLGVPKAGTTSLYFNLKKHPEVFAPEIKEPRFFSPDVNGYGGPGDKESNLFVVNSLIDYKNLYGAQIESHLNSDFSPCYLYSEIAPSLIKKYCGNNVKFIVILREPAERAFAHFTHLRREGREDIKTFEHALKQEESRKKLGYDWSWHYLSVSKYGKQIKNYLQHFDKKNFLFIDYNFYKINNEESILKILRFLSLSETYEIESIKRNISGIPSSPLLHNLIKSVKNISPDNRKIIMQMLPDSLGKYLKVRLHKLENANLRREKISEKERAFINKLLVEDKKLFRSLNLNVVGSDE